LLSFINVQRLAWRANELVKDQQLCFASSLAGLVVLAGGLYPIPSRTRP
jgi:hypothetical protein